MRLRLRWAFIGLPLVIVGSCFAANDGWSGTWKLNVSKSKVPGPNFTLTSVANGQYRVDNGTYAYTFGCDGKDYPTSPGHTVSCKLDDSSAMITIMKENGKIVRSHRWELSADGSRMTLTSTEGEEGKTPKAKSTVYVRTSGSAGFAGGWKNPNRLESHPRLVLKKKNGSLRIAFPEAGQYADVHLDGSDAIMHGPSMPTDMTIAMKPRGERELRTTKKSRGVIVNEGVLTLSADGRTLTEEYWSPSRPNEKAVLVYEKQIAAPSRN